MLCVEHTSKHLPTAATDDDRHAAQHRHVVAHADAGAEEPEPDRVPARQDGRARHHHEVAPDLYLVEEDVAVRSAAGHLAAVAVEVAARDENQAAEGPAALGGVPEVLAEAVQRLRGNAEDDTVCNVMCVFINVGGERPRKA